MNPPSPRPSPAKRRRGRRAGLLGLLVGVLVAGGGGSLAYVLSHPKVAGSTVATVITPDASGQPAASNQQVTPAPLFGTPPPDTAPPQTPAPTAAPTASPTATPGPTLPPLAVTRISICFVDTQGNCDAATTVQGCAANGTAGDACKYELAFQLAAGAGGTIDWSLSGTVSYCLLGTPALASKSFGPATGSVSVPMRPSDTTVTTAAQVLSLDVDPASHTTSTATVTSAEGGSSTGSTAFYGAGNC